jgi:hypothetical protein
MPRTVIYDACVLYPASIRSFLMWLGVHDLVHPRWTERILDECFDNLLADRPDLDPDALSRTRRLMCEAIPDCLVDGYDSRIQRLTLPDSDDRHVLAAALEANAEAIVTFNLDDFPANRLRPHGLEATHPDDLVCELLDTHAKTILTCLEDEASIRNDPPRSIHDVCQSPAERGLDQAADRMQQRLA